MRRQVAAHLSALAAAVMIAISSAALAADPPPPRQGERTHTEATKINQANPGVVHAGPGVPLTGTVFVPPSLDKNKKK